jgi:hypothetical protein
LSAARFEDWAHAVGLREGSGRQRAGAHSRGRISAASAATASRPTRWSSSITAMSEASPDGARSIRPTSAVAAVISSSTDAGHRRAAKTTSPLPLFDRRCCLRTSFQPCRTTAFSWKQACRRGWSRRSKRRPLSHAMTRWSEGGSQSVGDAWNLPARVSWGCCSRSRHCPGTPPGRVLRDPPGPGPGPTRTAPTRTAPTRTAPTMGVWRWPFV